MKIKFIVPAGLATVWMLFCAACVAESIPEDTAKVQAVTNITWIAENVLSYRCDGWELRIKYLNKGSRSEGQDGVLLKDGKPVKAAGKGETVDTSLGRIKYYGSERNVPWALTGWNFADRRRAKNSADIKSAGKPEKSSLIRID